MLRRNLLIAAPAAWLAACASVDSVSVQVSSQGSWADGRKPGTYAIERLPSQQANAAEQDRVEAAALPALRAAGFTQATSPEQAEVLIQVGARVFEVVRRDPFGSPFASPFYWRQDWWYYGYRRPFFYGPAYGLGYYEDYPDYHREVAVLVRDRRSQKIVYETRAMHTSRWTSNALLPALFEAALKDFPLPAISPRTVTVPLPPGA